MDEVRRAEILSEGYVCAVKSASGAKSQFKCEYNHSFPALASALQELQFLLDEAMRERNCKEIKSLAGDMVFLASEIAEYASLYNMAKDLKWDGVLK